MADETTTIQELKQWFRQFVAEREWEQFHAPKNLSMSLAIEAAELMEHFQWIDNDASIECLKDPDKFAAVADEIADIAANLFCLCNALSLDLSDAIESKMKKVVVKYPADQFRGRFE